MTGFYDLLQPPEEQLDLPVLAVHFSHDQRLRILTGEIGGEQDDLVGSLQPDDPDSVMVAVFLGFAHAHPGMALDPGRFLLLANGGFLAAFPGLAGTEKLPSHSRQGGEHAAVDHSQGELAELGGVGTGSSRIDVRRTAPLKSSARSSDAHLPGKLTAIAVDVLLSGGTMREAGKHCGLKDSAALNLKRRIGADLLEFFGEDMIRRLVNGVAPAWESDLRSSREHSHDSHSDTTGAMTIEQVGMTQSRSRTASRRKFPQSDQLHTE